MYLKMRTSLDQIGSSPNHSLLHRRVNLIKLVFISDRILNEFVQKTPAMADKKNQREVQVVKNCYRNGHKLWDR